MHHLHLGAERATKTGEGFPEVSAPPEAILFVGEKWCKFTIFPATVA